MLRPSCLRCSASECGLCDCFCPRWHLGSLIAFALGGTLDHCICSHVFGFGFFVLCLTSSWTWRDVKESGRQSWTWRDFKERRAGTGSNWTQKCGCSLLELGSTLPLGSCDLWGWAVGIVRLLPPTVPANRVFFTLCNVCAAVAVDTEVVHYPLL